MDPTFEQYLSVEHYMFFTIFIVLATVSVILQARLCWVIFNGFWSIPAYIVIAHVTVVSALFQITVVIISLVTFFNPDMSPTLSNVLGSIQQGLWCADYPTIFLLAANALFAIVFPSTYARLPKKITTAICLAIVDIWGLFNLIHWLMPQHFVEWHGGSLYFEYYGTDTDELLYNIMLMIDLPLVVGIVLIALALYAVILIVVVRETKQGRLYGRRQLPMLSNIIVVFVFTGIYIILWYFPMGDSEGYYLLFGLFGIIRSGIAPLAALATTKTIRRRFFKCYKVTPGNITVISIARIA